MLKIKLGQGIETSQRKIEIQGQKAIWIDCLRYYADAEFTEQCESLLKIESLDDEKYWTLKLEIFFKMSVNFFANCENNKGEKYFKNFCDLLRILMIDRINVELIGSRTNMFSNFQVEIQFNYHPHFDPDTKQKTGSSSSTIKQFKDLIGSFLIFIQNRVDFCNIPNKNLLKIIGKLEQINKYLDEINNGRISFNEYMILRRDRIQDPDKIKNRFAFITEEDPYPEEREELNKLLSDIERGTLFDLISYN